MTSGGEGEEETLRGGWSLSRAYWTTEGCLEIQIIDCDTVTVNDTPTRRVSVKIISDGLSLQSWAELRQQLPRKTTRKDLNKNTFSWRLGADHVLMSIYIQTHVLPSAILTLYIYIMIMNRQIYI